jgi:hypothetical protein
VNARFVAPITVVAVALLLSACPKQVETTPQPVTPSRPTPPPIRVPEGCEALIEGRFVHSQNAAYRYLAQDDGGTLLLLVERASADGGVMNDSDAGTVITLNRTPNGFNGSTEALVFTQRGARCRVSFPTDVVACEDGAVVLRSAASGSVDEQCRAPAKLPPAARVEHRLVRAGMMSADAGVRDAGSSSSDAGAISGERDAASAAAELKSARDAGTQAVGTARDAG